MPLLNTPTCHSYGRQRSGNPRSRNASTLHTPYILREALPRHSPRAWLSPSSPWLSPSSPWLSRPPRGSTRPPRGPTRPNLSPRGSPRGSPRPPRGSTRPNLSISSLPVALPVLPVALPVQICQTPLSPWLSSGFPSYIPSPNPANHDMPGSISVIRFSYKSLD